MSNTILFIEIEGDMQKSKGTRQQMFLMIERWKGSGQSQLAFCKKAGILYHIFHYWYKIYRDEKQSMEGTSSPFVALQIKPTDATTTPYAELILPNGKRLVFHHTVDVQTLQSLLS